MYDCLNAADGKPLRTNQQLTLLNPSMRRVLIPSPEIQINPVRSGSTLVDAARSTVLTMEVLRLDEASREQGVRPIHESHSSASTEQLVDACVAGDRCAMEQLYQQCCEHVYGLMVRLVGRQDADDLTQQVFLKTFRKLDQFNGESKLETWLYRLATNEALQHLRRSKRRSTAPLVTEPETSDPDRIGASEESELLETAMSRLEPELRAVLLLKEQQGLSYQEIAESVGIPEGTVGSRLNRARKELRQELTKLGWE